MGKNGDRVFGPSEAKGGCDVDPAKTAVVFIEYQNEFTSEGGKMHDAVKVSWQGCKSSFSNELHSVH